MIGNHMEVSTPAKLRKAAIIARKRKDTITVAREVLENAGLPPGSADLADWLDDLPGIDWHHWKGSVLTIHFEESEGRG